MIHIFLLIKLVYFFNHNPINKLLAISLHLSSLFSSIPQTNPFYGFSDKKKFELFEQRLINIEISIYTLTAKYFESLKLHSFTIQ